MSEDQEGPSVEMLLVTLAVKASSCVLMHTNHYLPFARLDILCRYASAEAGRTEERSEVNPKHVDGRVAQLRAQAKEEQASKATLATPPGAKRRPKLKPRTRPEWSVPEDCQGPVTAMEAEVGDLG